MPDPDAYLSICPSRPLMARLGEKWTVLVVASLGNGPMRFGELRRRLEGVSQKMLSQTLKNLERDGLLARTVIDERPLRVDYRLTSLGMSLVPLLLELKTWAEAHLKEIEGSREAYDAIH